MRLQLAAIMAVVACYGLVGNMAFDDAVAEQDLYCEMVESGAWPAYRGECDE